MNNLYTHYINLITNSLKVGYKIFTKEKKL